MDNVTIGFIGLGIGLFFIALRVPIGVALGSVSFVGIATIVNPRAAWGMLTAVPFNFVGDWNLTAIPMFLLMGYVAGSTGLRSEEHTSELQSLMRISYAVFCLKKKTHRQI